MAVKKKQPVREIKLLHWSVIPLLALTFIAYFSTMGFNFVNWDDIVYIMNNDMITAFSGKNLEKIFSSYFMGNYHPFILLSFLFDFHFFKFNAPGYHVHNLILHLVNAFLVYTFFFHLLKKNIPVAITVALLFALHPMHVESVAWVSERKDLLYTLYFFVSLICYLFYLRDKRQRYFYLALLMFVFSNLSKAQAVTLPVVLLLIDYLNNRKPDLKMFLEKIPFFAIALIFGIVAIFAQKAMNYINPLGIEVAQSIFFAPFGLALYLFKFFVPVNQVSIYEYPFTPEGTMPFYIYLSPLIFLFFAAVIWKTWKNQRYITFGALFFLGTIFPVLQFLSVGSAFFAERYTYIPYIGLSFIAAMAFWDTRSKMPLKNRKLMEYAGIFIILLMTVLTWNRAQIWHDSISMWTDVIAKNPTSVQAYSNRASYRNEMKDFDNTIRDLKAAIAIDPVDSRKLNLYSSLGMMYKKTGKTDSAIINYTKDIELNPAKAQSYLERGILYTDKAGNYPAGVADFQSFLALRPENLDGIFNLGIAFYKNDQFDSAQVRFLKVVAADPASGSAHNLLTTIFYMKQDFASAWKHALLASQAGAAVDQAIVADIKRRMEASGTIPKSGTVKPRTSPIILQPSKR